MGYHWQRNDKDDDSEGSREMNGEWAALVFCSLIAVAVLFQLALAAGAPWGGVAMGGRFPGRMPPALRVGAVIQAVVLLLLGVVVLAQAGLALPQWQAAADYLIWGVVAFSALSLVLNLITPIRWERLLWAPVAAGMLLCSLIVALA